MRARFFIVFSQILIFFAALSCEAQHYYFKHYGIDDGLAHNAVTSILQDHNGFIWIGTRAGLNRFDGYSFKTYSDANSKFGNVGNASVTTMAEDKKGILWIGTGKGIFKYDPSSEVLKPVDGVPETYITHLIIDKDDQLWFSANGSLFRYNRMNGRAEDLEVQARCIAIDNNKNLWLGDSDGMIRKYNPRSKATTQIRILDQSIPTNLRSISKILPIDENILLISCFKQGLKRYDMRTGKIKSLAVQADQHSSLYIRDMLASSENEYWLATESGIYIYNLKTDISTHLQKNAADPYAVSDNAFYSLCKDNQGGIWAGTFFGGLNYHSKQNARFNKYYPVAGINSISGFAVREISADQKGNLWIGTEDAGVNKFNPVTENFDQYLPSNEKGSISYPNIHGLKSIGNQLFIGPFYNGLEVMDIRTGLITDRFRFIGEKGDEQSYFVYSICLSKDGTLYIGTGQKGSGLFTYDQKRKQFTRIKEIPVNTYVLDVKEDSKGNIWVGSISAGAFYYNPKTGRHGNIRFGDSVNNKIINEFAVCGIMEDSQKAIWFTTEGGGLIRLSPDKKSIKKFSTKNGLPTNILFCILEDESKKLWISSLKGLICFDPRSERIKTYTKSNGLITDQFNFSSAYKDKNGKMYFGSVKGLIAFHPKQFDQLEPGPPVYITGLQINDQEVLPGSGKNSILKKSIVYTDTLVLQYDQNNFSIEFSALNYAAPEVTRYKFIMQGLNKRTNYLSRNRKTYFTDLSAGDYTFILQAESNVGSWIAKERRLFIRILPPFWKTQTAYIFYLILLAICLYYSLRYYHRHLARKNRNQLRLFEHKKEKEIYQAKIEFFTNIAHEIQTPVTLILGPVELLAENAVEEEMKKSLMMVERSAKRLADLTNQLLDFRKTEMNQYGLNFVNTDINALLKEQVATFSQEVDKNNISLTLELPENPLIAFADRDALLKICGNLISNAIKYADTKIVITLTAADETAGMFAIRYLNDGKGIPDKFSERVFEPFFRLADEEKPGTGIGLPLAKSLAELHHGSLKLVSEETNMVIFELLLPVHQEFEFTLSSWKKLK